MELVDTHAHLEGFVDNALMISNARAAGVCTVVAVSTNMETCRKTLKLAEEHSSFIYPALGIHPQEAGKNIEATFRFIEEHLNECIAIGEVGLDYWSKVEKELQHEIFSRLLECALSKDLPVSIHSRGAWEECFQMVRDKGVHKAVFHWFSGSLYTLKRVLAAGYLVSATPAIEYSKAHKAAIKEAPLEALMLETDSPVRYHGKVSEPADVAKTLRFVAELKGLSEEEVASKTTKNAKNFFKMRIL